MSGITKPLITFCPTSILATVTLTNEVPIETVINCWDTVTDQPQ